VRPARAAAAVAMMLSLSCSYMPLDGDRLFEANRLEEAAAAYERYLDRHSSVSGRSNRALYHLGLIYALSDGPLHDPERADRTLRELVAREDAGLYGRQARLILALQADVSRLQKESGTLDDLATRLESELAGLEQQAELASTRAGEQEDRARLLTTKVSQLRNEIERLTVALEKRTEELEKIKAIDLRRVP
jgi:hypothetical protein